MSNINIKQTNQPFWQLLTEHKIFCGFDVKPNANGRVDKLPKGMDKVTGIKENASLDKLGNYEQAKALGYPFIGISFTHPVTVIGKQLVCVDLDWKNAPDGMAHPKQLELMASLRGHAYETSYSGKGAHYWVLCEKHEIPESIKLSPFHEIEIFAGVRPGRAMNVMITDMDYSGELMWCELKGKFDALNMIAFNPPVEPKPAKEFTHTADMNEMQVLLQFINADDYTDWINTGMIIKAELGEDGYEIWDNWSRTSDKYDPFIMRTKWDSFKRDGLGLGTLIKKAQEHGYVGTHIKSSPNDDFNEIDPETGEIQPKKSLLERAYVPIDKQLTATEWILDGIIPNGVGVISGVGGVGKTTAIMPLAATVAGFDDHLSDISAKIRRKVLYITEDAVQANKAIYAMKKWRKSQNDIQQIGDWIHLYHSTQYSVNDLKALLNEAVNNHSSEYKGIIFPPLVIFDTASANIAVDNENDNAEIGKFMTLFKQMWAKYKMPIWLINHLAKSANGLSIDELDTFSARGASAWRDNGSWTANLAIDQDSDNRILQLKKVREEVDFNEIIFQSTVHHEFVEDVFGDVVEVNYRYCSASRSNNNQRISLKMREKEEELKEKILGAIEELEYPSGNDVYEVVGGKKTSFSEALGELKKQKMVVEVPLPSDRKVRGKYVFLSVPPKERN